MVFTSNDKLHQRVAPLFMRKDQIFVPGTELKADLAKLNEHYSALPEDVKQEGVMSFAFYPPVDGDFLTSRLWDRFMAREWRKRAVEPRVNLSPEMEKKIIADMKRMKTASAASAVAPSSSDEKDGMLFSIRVPVQMGKWRLLPPGIEKTGDAK
jgi:hypothetical protein